MFDSQKHIPSKGPLLTIHRARLCGSICSIVNLKDIMVIISQHLNMPKAWISNLSYLLDLGIWPQYRVCWAVAKLRSTLWLGTIVMILFVTHAVHFFFISTCYLHDDYMLLQHSFTSLFHPFITAASMQPHLRSLDTQLI